MTYKKTATPLPWKLYDRGIGWEVHGPDGNTVNDGFRGTLSYEDATLIVRAVNAHDELVTACEAAYLCLLQSLPATRARSQHGLAALRDAIALARGQSPEDVQNEFEERAGITP